MSVSIKDIANALNLSKATVSWILSGQGESKGFSEKTIKRVKEYAKSVNYRPNLVARSLSLGFSKTLGLVIPFLRDSYYAQMAYYIEKEAAKNGYSLIVCSSEGDGNKEYELIYTLIAKRVDGLIIAPTKTEVKGIKYLQKLDIPFVLVDRYYQNMETNYVIVDNFGSAYELVEALVNKGAKKIATLVTDAHLFVMKQRVEGYSAALREAGVKEDFALKVFVDRQNYRVDIDEKLDCLFREVPDVDGFFFTTHYLAMAAIRYMVKRGVDYHRFKMGVFHTMAGLDVLAPEMAATVFPIEELGAEAVDILLANIREGKDFVLQAKVLQNTFLPSIGDE
ncbi:LacI family DNA-binding transcriptional regulator [Phocaeicola sp. KGMB11183]|uniref:LacI family DNA-binding transcriptional regulator n=1 Tax=Phocaeicola acetigenes TaxID=3016083 RepID=A0ABT4PF36_9BACT|nr:LacI family DNA-binding transcriptional regulator [Phocaeicola sp. KGMB11183]MCZ8371661.1 LacI family DNA-binding transcriptional regulator [Phocaeicola sp. KGMB11183]